MTKSMLAKGMIKTWWQISCDVWFGWIFNAVMAIVYAVLRK